MQTHIALLRGINVGGNNLLPMAELTKLLSSLGLKDIQTYIQSGNVVFNSSESKLDKLSHQIQSLIELVKGFKPKILLLSLEEFNRSIEACPFSEDDGKLLHFFFLDDIPPNADLELLKSLKKDTEEYQLIGKVFYLHAPEGIGRSKLADKVEKAMGVPASARNWNTVRKIQILAGL